MAGDREHRDCRRRVRSTDPGICARPQSQPERRRQHAEDVRPAYGGRSTDRADRARRDDGQHRDSRRSVWQKGARGAATGAVSYTFSVWSQIKGTTPATCATTKSTIRQARRQRIVRTRVMGLNCSRRILGEGRRVRLRQTCHSAKLFPVVIASTPWAGASPCCTLRRRSPPNHLVDSTSYRARLFSRCSRK